MAESLLIKKSGGGAKIIGKELSYLAAENIQAGDFVGKHARHNNLNLSNISDLWTLVAVIPRSESNNRLTKVLVVYVKQGQSSIVGRVYNVNETMTAVTSAAGNEFSFGFNSDNVRILPAIDYNFFWLTKLPWGGNTQIYTYYYSGDNIVSGFSQSWGSSFDNVYDNSVITLDGGRQLLIFYRNTYNFGPGVHHLTYRVGNSSNGTSGGTSVSGASYTSSYQYSFPVSSVTQISNNGGVFLWQNQGNPYQNYVISFTVSGTSISFGSSANIGTQINPVILPYNPYKYPNKFLVVYNDSTYTPGNIKVSVMSASGTSTPSFLNNTTLYYVTSSGNYYGNMWWNRDPYGSWLDGEGNYLLKLGSNMGFPFKLNSDNSLTYNSSMYDGSNAQVYNSGKNIIFTSVNTYLNPSFNTSFPNLSILHTPYVFKIQDIKSNLGNIKFLGIAKNTALSGDNVTIIAPNQLFT